METEVLNLKGKFCPYPIMHIIEKVDILQKNSTIKCLVDDPLAIKSVPEELEEYDDVSISITKETKGWEISIKKIN